jgi:hypothetical protein
MHVPLIHIVRDIRDVMASLLPLDWTPDLELSFPRFWSNSNLYLHSLYHDKPQYLQVKYEELVQFPERTLERVCAHVGIDFQSNQLSPERRHPRYQGVPAHAKLFQPITAASVGGYPGKLNPVLVESIERQAAEAMIAFNYRFASPFGRAYQEVQYGGG